GKDITIPVSFSLTGVYGNGTNISAFINVDDPSLKINGPLMIKDVANGLQWDLNIINGQIAFPGRSLEKMTGKIGFQTNGLLLQSVAGDVSIFTNQERRDIGIKLDKKRGLFSGSMALKWWDTTKATKPEMRTTLDLNVADLKLLGNGVVQTNHPIQIALTTQYSKSLQIKELVGSLNGQLTCQLFDNCSYHLTKPAMFSVKRISLYEQGYEVRSKPRYRFSLDPVKDFWNMSFKTGRVNFKFQSKNFVFNGEQVESKSDISIKTILGRIDGYLNLWSKDISAKVELNGLEYQSPTVNMRQSYLLAEDILDENARFYLRSHHINLKNNPRIKVPFYLEYTKNKGISDIVVSLENRGIQLLFGGVVDWIGGNVNGQLVVPGIALGSLKQPLNRISDLFPAEFKKTYGKISAYGRLSGNLYSGLNGPMYLSLMDFGFETDDIEVQHLNAALTAQTLSPFTTEPNQRIHIGEIKSFLPITNVDIILKAEDNYAQLHDVTAQVAGIPLVAGETVVPYKNIGTLIYFKNQDENLAPMLKNVGGDTWKIASMRGSILLPVEIKNMTLNVKNAMLDILGANLQYTGNSKKRPNFLSKDDQMNITSGTVSFDGDGQARKGVKISILWDVIMLPSRLKKTIRETMSIKDLGLLDFGSVRGQEPPSDIMQKVRYIQDKADAFRMK
ncbi:MAG: hypothetical protein SPL08_04845, partial [Pseudomonadota bacterium]|nr:hypothetical protein [Pseudomonadota bacterium]